MTERRKYRRIPLAQFMEALLIVEGIRSRGRVVDLNNAGAFVATDLLVGKGTNLEIELSVTDVKKSPRLKALVARRIEAVAGRERTIPGGLALVFRPSNVMEKSFIQMAVLEALKMSLESTRARVSGASTTSLPTRIERV